jgi:hypothetical protein
MKILFLDVLMTGSDLIVYSNCFSIPREGPSHTYGSFSFGALSDRLVVGLLGVIVHAIKTNPLETAYIETLDKIYI